MKSEILSYASSATCRKPRRWWLPLAFLGVAAGEWHFPRLTPTFFPTLLDNAMLGLLLVGAIVIGYASSLPGWAVSGFGALGVCLYLVANLHDNNFRANYYWGGLLLPWCPWLIGGAIVARLAGAAGRLLARQAASRSL